MGMEHYNRNHGHQDGPRLICHGRTQHASIEFPSGTYEFDRRAKTWCREWDIKVGEPFVAVGFNAHSGGPPGPHMPDRIPPWLPGHLHWFLYYDSHDQQSHYTRRFYTQDPEVSYHMDTPTMALFLINGGVLTRTEWYTIVIGVVICGF